MKNPFNSLFKIFVLSPLSSYDYLFPPSILFGGGSEVVSGPSPIVLSPIQISLASNAQQSYDGVANAGTLVDVLVRVRGRGQIVGVAVVLTIESRVRCKRNVVGIRVTR